MMVCFSIILNFTTSVKSKNGSILAEKDSRKYIDFSFYLLYHPISLQRKLVYSKWR